MSLQMSVSQLMDYQPKSYLFILASSWIAYQLFKSTYNLFFHPLRHIPGPKLAAATYFSEFYYDVVQFGRYTNRIKEMHERYGTMPFAISPHLQWRWSNADISTQVLLFALALMNCTAVIVALSTRSMLQETGNVTSPYTKSGAAGRKEPRHILEHTFISFLYCKL